MKKQSTKKAAAKEMTQQLADPAQKAQNTRRVSSTKRSRIPCMECRPSWAREMSEKEREASAKKAADIRRCYGIRK